MNDYTPTTLQNFDRRLALYTYVQANVLVPLKDDHGMFKHVAFGLPHSEEEMLRDVVHDPHLPAAFVDRAPAVPMDTTAGASRAGPSFSATVAQRISDQSLWITVLDRLRPQDNVVTKHEHFAVGILDLMYAVAPLLGGNALTVELVREGNTHRNYGDRIALSWEFLAPTAWKVR